MSENWFGEGLHVDERPLSEDEDSIYNRELDSNVPSLIGSSQSSTVTGKASTLGKRAAKTEIHGLELTAEHTTTSDKKAKLLGTAKEHISSSVQHQRKPEENKPSIFAKSKETDSSKVVAKPLDFYQQRETTHEDLKSQTYRSKSKPIEESENQSSSGTTPAELLQRSLLRYPHLFRMDEDGDTILHIAIVHNDATLARAIISAMVSRKEDHPDENGLDIPNNLWQVALHLAVLTCQPRIVQDLAENGADVNAIDRNGQTALHLACKNADVEDIRALRNGVQKWNSQNESNKRAIQVNSRNFEGLAPIHLASLTGSCEVLDELLEMKADVDLTDSTSGRTALHHAVEAHNPVVTRFLLRHDANINAQTFAGNTPLHSASGCHMEAIVPILLAFGANPRIRNIEGDLPLPDTHVLHANKLTK